MSENTQFIHIDLTITLNEDDWGSYAQPNATENVRFKMPLEMFNEINFKNMVTKRIKGLEKEFPLVKLEAEREEEAQAQLEAEAQTETEENVGE